MRMGKKAKGKTSRGVKRMKSRRKTKKTEKLKPIKIAALILSAIQDLSESKGSTLNEISGYISYASKLPEHQIKRQVNSVLKQGVEYGVLRRYRGHFFLPSGDELDRANRMATRFAHLASPVPSNLFPTPDENSGVVIESQADVNSQRPRKSEYPLANKNPKRTQSLSASSGMSDTTSNENDSSIASDAE